MNGWETYMYKKVLQGIIISLIGVVILFVGVCSYKGISLRGINSVDELIYRVVNRFAHRSEVENFLLWIYPIEDKFWLHRTNTTYKLMTKGAKYKGVELDIVYHPEINEFDNSHDKADIIEYPLEDMLKILGNTNHKIWLDYKNLEIDNAMKSRDRLEELLAIYGIDKKRCIVESSNYQELKIFHEHGFYTSYYAPLGLAEHDPLSFQENIKLVAAVGDIDAVSFSWEYYELIKNTGIDKDLLLWDSGSKWWVFFLEAKRNKIRQDDAVKVILVEDYSKMEH